MKDFFFSFEVIGFMAFCGPCKAVLPWASADVLMVVVLKLKPMKIASQSSLLFRLHPHEVKILIISKTIIVNIM